MKKALIVSFPRSGTHFLMNTLRACFNYDQQGHGSLEPLGFNFYVPNNVWWVLSKMNESYPGIPLCVKSHHEHEFFDYALPNIMKDYTVFYVYREMEAVMRSYCKHINGLPWTEGPKTIGWKAFAEMAPVGGMLRYQVRQYKTMQEKYEAHVENWLASPMRSEIIYVKYEDLNKNFDIEVRNIAERIGKEPTIIERPDAWARTVHDGEIALYT